jgi:hypothetical protein
MEGFAQEAPHLRDAAPERSAARAASAEESLATEGLVGLAQAGLRPLFQRRAVTFARSPDLICDCFGEAPLRHQVARAGHGGLLRVAVAPSRSRTRGHRRLVRDRSPDGSARRAFSRPQNQSATRRPLSKICTHRGFDRRQSASSILSAMVAKVAPFAPLDRGPIRDWNELAASWSVNLPKPSLPRSTFTVGRQG